jgi:hypothetical protein
MPGSWPAHELPNLTDETCEITSLPSRQYNCIAWAAGDDQRVWWPDPFGISAWPVGAPRTVTMDAFVKAYETRGYTLCYDNSLEPGLEKVAIYGITSPVDGTTTPTHAALQLESGEWTSKLGPFEDVRHKKIEDVNGPVYGRALFFMSRLRAHLQNE